MISFAVALLFRIIYLIIILVVLMSWIQIFDARKEPVITLVKVYNAIMSPFRFIPPIGMIDISPLIAFIILQIIERMILTILGGFGL